MDAVIYLWDFNRRQVAFVGIGPAKWDDSGRADAGFC